MNILQKDFYARCTIEVARDLLGKVLIREINGKILTGIIVETEAYASEDAACHAYNGKTDRNKALFGPVGHAYIYFIYGNYFCFNTVAKDSEHEAGGVLIRALKPVEGIDLMSKFRNTDNILNLTNGPGKLAQALAIDKSLYGTDLTKKNDIYLIEGKDVDKKNILATSRIGINKATDKLWRFIIS